jgi:hypothetical protein
MHPRSRCLDGCSFVMMSDVVHSNVRIRTFCHLLA